MAALGYAFAKRGCFQTCRCRYLGVVGPRVIPWSRCGRSGRGIEKNALAWPAVQGDSWRPAESAFWVLLLALCVFFSLVPKVGGLWRGLLVPPGVAQLGSLPCRDTRGRGWGLGECVSRVCPDRLAGATSGLVGRHVGCLRVTCRGRLGSGSLAAPIFRAELTPFSAELRDLRLKEPYRSADAGSPSPRRPVASAGMCGPGSVTRWRLT